MTNQEFSNEFDILYNNIMSNQAPGLDEYEKSVFLTQAQEEIVKAYYKGTNLGIGPFENTEDAREALSKLLTFKYMQIGPDNTVNLIDDIWYIVYEEVFNNNTDQHIQVVPITLDEWHKIRNNPFRQPSKDRILKIAHSSNTIQLLVLNNQILSDSEVYRYYVKYIKQPNPIILVDLPNNLTINGKQEQTNCGLHPSIHRLILTQAVQLAAAAYKSNN